MVAISYRSHLRNRLIQSNVPVQLHSGVVEYLVQRRPMGHFLTAIVNNDLAEACARADDDNRYRLYDLMFFFWNYAPAPSWGSPAKVKAWLADPDPPVEIFE